MEKTLSEAKVKDIMYAIVKDPTVVSAKESISNVLKKILDDARSRHAYVVDDSGKLIGSLRINNIIAYLFPSLVFTEDISAFPVSTFVEYTNAKSVEDIMNNDPAFVYKETTLKEMIKIMIQEKINELPVVDENLFVIGEVNIMELIAYYLRQSK